MHIGEKIRKLRQLKDMSQAELANKINKSRSLISNVELTGKVNFYTREAIAKALNVSVEDLENFSGKVELKEEHIEEHPLMKEVKKEMERKEKEYEDLKRENYFLHEKVEHYKTTNRHKDEIIRHLHKQIATGKRKK